MFNSRCPQEKRSADIIAAFQKMLKPSSRVLRGGRVRSVPAEALVVGDVVHLAMGDCVPADLRVVENTSCKLDVSTLTGESDPVPLTTTATDNDPHRSQNMAFFSNTVVEGLAKGVVIRTAADSTVGRIAELTAKIDPGDTALDKDINSFLGAVAYVSLFANVIIFVAAMYIGYSWCVAVGAALGALVLVFASCPPVIVTVRSQAGVHGVRAGHAGGHHTGGASPDRVRVHVPGRQAHGAAQLPGQGHGGRGHHGLHVRHLLRQDGHADAEQDDGGAPVVGGPRAARRGRRHARPGQRRGVGRPRAGCPGCCVAVFRETLVWEPALNLKPLPQVGALCNRAQLAGTSGGKAVGDASEVAILKFIEARFGGVYETRLRYAKVYEEPFNSTKKYQV